MSSIRKIGTGILLFIFIASIVPCLYAADDPATKFSRGIVNIVTSPGEYFVQITKLCERHDPMTALLGGLFHGTYRMAERIGVGIYDILTFPVPIPEDYKPLIEPPTVLDDIEHVNIRGY